MSFSDELVEELLSKPVGKPIAVEPRQVADLTREVVISRNTAEVQVPASEAANANEGTALEFLQKEGQNPDDWEVTGFRRIEYGKGMTSVRFTYRRKAKAEGALPLDDLLVDLEDYSPVFARQDGSYGFLVLIGDMQFGKADGDGVLGTLTRTVECINRAADEFARLSMIYDIGHIHVAWLGDHVEGFTSQGGANAWRTSLTLSEQIRLTRRVMLHAVKTFAPLAEKVTLAAVPGNHGETVRFEGKGVTRFDDSHDTESLIAVMDACELVGDGRFDNVEFYVPDNDELTVLTEVAGTRVLHTHGHKFGSGKEAHWTWWQGQEFGNGTQADLLIAGHLHHEFVDTKGKRKFMQTPALESESTWFRHSKGDAGAPGILVALTRDGSTPLHVKVSADE